MSEIAFAINIKEEFPIVSFHNYCTNETLAGLAKKVCDLCDEDRNHLIFDFSKCQLVNSLGLAALLEVLMMVQDYEGKVAITGLDATKQKFFSLTGVFTIAQVAGDLNEAQQLLK